MKRKRPTLAQLITAQRHLLKATKGLVEEISILRRYILEMREMYARDNPAWRWNRQIREEYKSGDVQVNWHTGSHSPTDSIDVPR